MKKVMKRIVGFDRNDWSHISFLLKNCIKQFFLGNFKESIDALFWVRIHLSYDSKLIKENDNEKSNKNA